MPKYRFEANKQFPESTHDYWLFEDRDPIARLDTDLQKAQELTDALNQQDVRRDIVSSALKLKDFWDWMNRAGAEIKERGSNYLNWSEKDERLSNEFNTARQFYAIELEHLFKLAEEIGGDEP